jgi:protein-L-isoaspartate(D-aspartate) O-methyltransferase
MIDTAPDFALQRKNMVESQVRPSDITDRRIIRAIADVPRELFVPAAVQSIAYSEEAITVAAARSGSPRRQILPTRTLAALIQMLDLDSSARVLVIGAATGYGAAIVAQIGAIVTALEVDSELAAAATRTLAGLKVANVSIITGPLNEGHTAGAPYDAILIEGAVTAMPIALLDQLKDGGRLAAIVADRGVGRATLWQRSGSAFASRAVRDANAAVVPGFESRPAFVF